MKLEWENNAFERARILLKKACDRAPTAKVWMKAALLERELKAPEAALKLLETALPSYPAFSKLYMMAGQVCDCVCVLCFLFVNPFTPTVSIIYIRYILRTVCRTETVTVFFIAG